MRNSSLAPKVNRAFSIVASNSQLHFFQKARNFITSLLGKVAASYGCRVARTIHIYVYTVYIWHSKQRNHHTYGHIRCAYMVLANPIWLQ